MCGCLNCCVPFSHVLADARLPTCWCLLNRSCPPCQPWGSSAGSSVPVSVGELLAYCHGYQSEATHQCVNVPPYAPASLLSCASYDRHHPLHLGTCCCQWFLLLFDVGSCSALGCAPRTVYCYPHCQVPLLHTLIGLPEGRGAGSCRLML